MAKSSSPSNVATIPKSDSRAKSERSIAALDRVTDRVALEAFLKSPNKRLQARAAYKLAEPDARAGLTAAKQAKKTAS